jgi:spermidine synthase
MSNNFRREGNELVQYDNGVEYSRFDFKTKECKHWYARTICMIVIEKVKHLKEMTRDLTKKINILVLGVALGGIIIHLLNKLDNITIIGVDISDENYNIVEENSDNNRLDLIKYDAEKYIKETDMKFDIIICDIFNGSRVPDFVLGDDFIFNCKRILNENGCFIINTINVDKNLLKEKYNRIFETDYIFFEYQYGHFIRSSNLITQVSLTK